MTEKNRNEFAIKTKEESEKEELELPILRHSQEIKEMINSNPTTIIVGETGSGKTTQIPLILRETMLPEDKIIITQPRRVATRSVARYVAKNAGCQIGEDIGYQVRFEDYTTEGTRINFMTDGILLRKIQEDPLLQNYSAVMIDEAHERSLNIDFTLGLLKELQEKRADANLLPLKIIVTSATLEKEKFAHYFGESPTMEIPGRLYPVDVHYEKEPIYDYTESAAEKVKMIIERDKEGDILIFMPGQEEINKTIKEIKKLKLVDTTLLPLYGQMSPEEQDKIFKKTVERKIIVATNIAETSVTIPGVSYVIDSGLIKQMEFNSSTGIETLAVRPHAKSGCVQRAGRAGRVASGECWRLYSENDFNNRSEFQTPEIQRSNLARVVLMMKKIGVKDVKSFEFIDQPKTKVLEKAINTLETLGALDENKDITKIGETMAELPLEPHIARMVIEAEKHNCVESVCTIASLLNSSIFIRPKGKEDEADAAHQHFKVPESDFLTLLNVWQEYTINNYRDKWARDNFLRSRALAEARQIRFQLFRALRRNGIHTTQSQNPEAISKSVAAGLIGNLMESDSRHSYRRVNDNETGFFIHPSSATFEHGPEFFVPAEIIETSKVYARTIQEVKPKWIREIAPQLTKEEIQETYYDLVNDRVVCKIAIFLKENYSLLTKEEQLLSDSEETMKVFAEALAQGEIDLPFIKQNKQIIETINDMWCRDEGKFIKQQFSLEDLKMFYTKRLGIISSKKELEIALQEEKINLEIDINELIPLKDREEILYKNPDSIEILGVNHQIQYNYDRWRGKFSASVKILDTNILKLVEIPVLPSGKGLILEVINSDNKNQDYTQFSGTNLEELKEKSRQFLIKKQWDNWRYTKKVEDQHLKNFNPLGEMPDLPEPLEFGFNPETGEPLLAFPAVAVSSYYSGNEYYISYFLSQKLAEEAQVKVLGIMEQAKIDQLKKEKREQLVAPVLDLLQKVKNDFDTIGYDYKDYGLSYNDKNDINDKVWEAEKKLTVETKEALSILQEVNKQITQAFDYKKERILAQEKVDMAIVEHYNTCPLCDQLMKNSECTNPEHNVEKIDFEVDKDGYKIGPVMLSQISTEKEKIIAQLWASYGERTRDFRRHQGDIYFVKGSSIKENGWQGEPFKSFKFEDFNKILTLDEIEEKRTKLKVLQKEKKEIENRERYRKDLEYAEQQVEQGYWKQGKFKKSIHPKTGEEQWELTLKNKKLVVKYILDHWSQQPITENTTYFYSEKKTIINTNQFRLISVQLENPFPENKPEKEVMPQSSSQPESHPESLKESLEELKKKWGAR